MSSIQHNAVLCLGVFLAAFTATAFAADLDGQAVADTAYETAITGNPQQAVDELMAFLRDAKDGSASTIDDTIAPMHALMAVMRLFLPKEDLHALVHDRLATSSNPVDRWILCQFQHDFHMHVVNLDLTPIPPEQLRDEVKTLIEADSELVRAGAFALLATPGWHTQNGNEYLQESIQYMNELAAVCPDAKMTHEIFREQLRVCMGNQFDSTVVEQLLQFPAWNEKVKNLIQRDAVVHILISAVNAGYYEVDGERTLRPNAQANRVAAVLNAGLQHADPAVQDWSLRSTMSMHSFREDSLTNIAGTEKTRYEGLASQGVAASESDNTEPTPLPPLRSAYMLFANAVEDSNATAAEPYVGFLSRANWAQEPVDINFYERIPYKLRELGVAYVREDKLDQAIAHYKMLSAQYPGTAFASDCQDHIDHLSRVQEVRAERKP